MFLEIKHLCIALARWRALATVFLHAQTRKLCYRKDDRVKRPIYRCPENFRESLTMPTATFPDILMDFCSDNPIDPVNMHTKFDVRSFNRS